MKIPVIGLEIHSELKTSKKMFCSCVNDFDETSPNKNICPICVGHPGTLPTINKEAVDSVIKLGIAINGKIGENSHFDRKSYFYPDLPKGYQISQYDCPLVSGGLLCGVRIRRVHLEEDTARLLHELPSIEKESNKSSFVDFNRAGIPLMELVTEPDIKTGKEAVMFAKELQKILRYLGISDANMEKGQMRVEVNISMSDSDVLKKLKNESDKNYESLGTKVEIKNINSFKAVEQSIDYEIKRQSELIKSGGVILQETRGWDDSKCVTVSQRTKESSHDYRYFPEPDLPPLKFSKEYIKKLSESLPEMPAQKKDRFKNEFGLSEAQAENITEDINFANYFEEAMSELVALSQEKADSKLVFNYLTSDIKGILNISGISILDLKINPEHFAHLIFLIQTKKLSSRIAKDLILKMSKTGEDPEVIMSNEGIKSIGDDASLLEIVRNIIKNNEKAVSDFKKGKINSLQFLVGKAMAETKGQGDPEKLRELFKKEIS